MNSTISSIVQFWDKAGISSISSSTCSGNSLHHDFDNKIEKHRLSLILTDILARERNTHKFKNAIDIGSGLGRFLPILKTVSQSIVALEPAEQLYEKLVHTWKDDKSIAFERNTWESHVSISDRSYDLIIASGVLYFYDQDMLDSFFKCLSERMSADGIFIARDFLTRAPISIPSEYLPNSNCYYRNIDFWSRQAATWGLKLRLCTLSKPQLSVLRNKYISSVFRLFGFESFIWRSQLLCLWSKSKGISPICDSSIPKRSTCFLVFSRYH